jgi:hypothetical protein
LRPFHFAAVGNASNNQAKQQAAVASHDQRPKLSSAEIVIETADSFIIFNQGGQPLPTLKILQKND